MGTPQKIYVEPEFNLTPTPEDARGRGGGVKNQSLTEADELKN